MILLAGCAGVDTDVVADSSANDVTETGPSTATESASTTPSMTQTPTPTPAPTETEADTSSDSVTSVTQGRWTLNTTGTAEATVENGVHTYSVYKCERATGTRSLGYTDEVTLNLDYELTAEQWWEVPTVSVYVDGERVYRGTVGDRDGETVFDAEAYGTTDGTIDETVQTGGNTTVRVGLTPSNYCSAGDHATTTLSLSNVSLSTPTAESTGLQWTQNTTGDATATVNDTGHSYSVYKCERATSTTKLGDTDSVSLAFDYELTAEQWWEVPTVEVYVDDERVFRGKVGQGEGETIFDAEAYGTASGSVNETIQTGGDTEVLIGVTPSNYCDSGDHATTTLTVTDLSVSTEE